jgi:excisionase family DNA binding protein
MRDINTGASPKGALQAEALPPLDPLQRYTTVEAARYLRISRASLYNDIAEGLITTIKDRSRRLVPGTEIVRRSRAEVHQSTA